MATSLINVQTQGSQRGVNVLAQDTSTGTALENAIAAGVAALGGTFQAAAELGGGPIGLIIPSAVPPATDGTPKALYRVDFRPGSGPNGANPASLFVLAWPQTSGHHDHARAHSGRAGGGNCGQRGAQPGRAGGAGGCGHDDQPPRPRLRTSPSSRSGPCSRSPN